MSMNWPLRSLALGLALASADGASAQPATPPSAGPPPANYSAPVNPAPRAASTVAPLFTRQTVFAIPFKIDASAGGQRPAGVQLHLSDDGGRTWRLYEQVEPGASKFNFRADHDGDYQFFVRTLDSAGQLQPAAPPQAELRVVVDTLAPRLEISATQAQSGEIHIQWRALDRFLKPQSLKVEFQVDGSTEWNAVTVPPVAPGAEKIDSGELTFWPGAAVRDVVIRAQVDDEAGNPALAQTEVGDGAAIRQAATRKEEPLDAAPGQWQSIDDQASPGGKRWATASTAQQPLGAEPAPEDIGPPPAAEEVPAGVPMGRVADSYAPPTRAQVETTSSSEEVAPENDPFLSRAPHELPPTEAEMVAPGAEQVAPAAEKSIAPEEYVAPDEPAMTAPDVADEPDTSELVIAPAQEPTPPVDPAPLARDPRYNFDRLPAGQRPRLVNSRKFEIDYEVEAIGAVAISKIELWGTRDGGQTWSSFGFDNDNRSPFTVAVDQEGTFGFRLVVETANGLGGLPPRSGDTADVWVAVDQTKPAVRLLSVDERPDDDISNLVIRWEAEDLLLAANPIVISYSDRASGPWTVIAEGLDNTGEYVWRVDRRMPARIYLQVQARDEAGNLGAAETPNAISLERLRPQGRIRQIRPSRDAKRKGGWSFLR
jgi:hypothetical protein